MVRIGGDIGGIELEAGDTITVNGNDWVYQSDGTLEGPAISIGYVSIGEWGSNADYIIRNTGSEVVAFNTNSQRDQFSGAEISGVLNNCLSELKDGNGEAQGQIFIAAGDYDYQFNVPLDGCGGISIVGAGFRSTRITQADGANADLFVYSDATQEEFFRIQDMTIKGNNGNNSSGRMLYSTGSMADVQLVRVFASGFPGNGVETQYTWGWKLNHFVSEFHGGDGLFVTSGANRGLAAYGCKFNLNESRGVRDNSTGESQYLGCEFGSNNQEGLYLGGTGTQVVASSVYNNSQAGSGSYDGVLCGDADATFSAIYIDGASMQDYGINYGGAATDCRLGVHRIKNNVTGSLRDAGTNNQRVSLTAI